MKNVTAFNSTSFLGSTDEILTPSNFYDTNTSTTLNSYGKAILDFSTDNRYELGAPILGMQKQILLDSTQVKNPDIEPVILYTGSTSILIKDDSTSLSDKNYINMYPPYASIDLIGLSSDKWGVLAEYGDVDVSKDPGYILNTYFDPEYAGAVKSTDNIFSLDTKYKQPKTYIIYYGQLEFSGLTDYSVYDIIVTADTTLTQIQKVQADGCEVHQYLAWGSRYEDASSWFDGFKATIKSLVDDGKADGIFFDECDVGYWDLGYYDNEEKKAKFSNDLKEMCDYCNELGVESFPNGTRSFGTHGDYILWESFTGYWNTNRLNWSTSADSKTTNADGSVIYNRNLNNWTLSGSLKISDGKIIDGSSGEMYIDVDLDSIIDPGEVLTEYDWVYYEWFGEGADNDTCEIYAWIGDSLPFSTDWTELPKLFSGEPETWNGINQQSKYIRLKMIFDGAYDLEIESCFLAYGYVYPYYDMSKDNPPADDNTFLYNYNHVQLDYYLTNNRNYDNEPYNYKRANVATHCFGESTDLDRIEYMFTAHNMFNFHMWDYTHPLHQELNYTEILDNPVGMLLSRESTADNTYSATFTGASATIDIKNSTHTLTRNNEPGYWYDRTITINGDMTDWSTSMLKWTNPKSEGLNLSKYGFFTDFSTGTFNNTQNVGGNLDLIIDGAGDWESPVLTPFGSLLSSMVEVYFNGDSTNVKFYVKYQRNDDSWTAYTEYTPKDTIIDVDEELKACQFKIEINGTVGNDKCYGYSNYYQSIMEDSVNLREFYATDDQANIYFRLKFNDVIDFENNSYRIYMQTRNSTVGFKGTFWETTNFSDFYIDEAVVYNWKDSSPDSTSSTNFQYLGEVVDYNLSTDQKEIEYKLTKRLLKKLPLEDVKFYAYLEDSNGLASLIGTSGIGTGSPVPFTGQLTHTQLQYNNYSPHGYYKSEDILVNSGDGYTITFDSTTPSGTSAKVYTRNKIYKNEWSSWSSVQNGEVVSGDIERMQYCVSLNTTNGNNTPSISNINIT